jgi:hypothetical protein
MIRHPQLHIVLPRPINAIHQIEITSRCNLKCSYCPSPNLGRPKVDMTNSVFDRALQWVKHYVAIGKQNELNLAGIGESTIHPQFIDFLARARGMFPTIKIIFATNGIQITEEQVAQMAPYNPEVWVSLHQPKKAAEAVSLYRKYDLLKGISIDPSVNANDWAGQVKWKNDFPGDMACQWLRSGKVMVMADGRITTCCLDATGAGVIGHVDDQIGSIQSKPYDLCKTCHQEIGIVGHDQRNP